MDFDTFLGIAKNYYLLAKRKNIYSFWITITINELTRDKLPLHSDKEFLTYFTNHLSECLRKYDLVCRDEDNIHILLGDINENTAYTVLDRIQNFINEQANQIYLEHLIYQFESVFKMEKYYKNEFS